MADAEKEKMAASLRRNQTRTSQGEEGTETYVDSEGVTRTRRTVNLRSPGSSSTGTGRPSLGELARQNAAKKKDGRADAVKEMVKEKAPGY